MRREEEPDEGQKFLIRVQRFKESKWENGGKNELELESRELGW